MGDNSPQSGIHSHSIARGLPGLFALFVLGVGALAHLLGETVFLLLWTLVAAVGLTFVSRLVALVRHQLVFDFAIHPWRPEHRRYLWQLLLRAATYVIAIGCLWLALPRAIMPQVEYLAAFLVFGLLPGGLLTLMQLVPQRHVSVSMNLLHAIYAILLGIQLLSVFAGSRFSRPIAIQPPFRGEWVVIQGGRSSLIKCGSECDE